MPTKTVKRKAKNVLQPLRKNSIVDRALRATLGQRAADFLFGRRSLGKTAREAKGSKREKPKPEAELSVDKPIQLSRDKEIAEYITANRGFDIEAPLEKTAQDIEFDFKKKAATRSMAMLQEIENLLRDGTFDYDSHIHYAILVVVDGLVGYFRQRDFHVFLVLIDRFLARIHVRYRQEPAILLLEAGRHMLCLEEARAYTLFRRAARHLKDDPLALSRTPKKFRAVHLVSRFPDNIISTESVGPHKPYNEIVRWLVKENTEIPETALPPITIVAFSDKVYFSNFAFDFASQLQSVGAGSNLHFHVVGWDQRCDVVLEKLKGMNLNVSVALEEYDIPDDFVYFASVRFKMLRALMDVFQGVLYVTDIDNLILTDPDKMRADYGRFDIGVRMSKWRHFMPWLFPAGAIMVNSTDMARIFADMLRVHFEAKFVPDKKGNWYQDQLILNETLISFEKKHPWVQIRNLGSLPYLSGSRPDKTTVANGKEHRIKSGKVENLVLALALVLHQFADSAAIEFFMA